MSAVPVVTAARVTGEHSDRDRKFASVTDPRGVTGETFSREGRFASVTEPPGVTDENVPREVHSASVTLPCGTCGRTIGAGEPLHIPLWNWPRTQLCHDCAPADPGASYGRWPTWTCHACGREFTAEDRRYRTACSDKCRSRRGNQLRRQRQGRPEHTRPCRLCQATFTPRRDDAEFCSSACRQKAYRRRLAEVRIMTAGSDR